MKTAVVTGTSTGIGLTTQVRVSSVSRSHIGGNASLSQRVHHHLHILDVKVSLPKLGINRPKVAGQPITSPLTNIRYAHIRNTRIPDLLGPLQHKPLPLRVAASISIGIFHPRPLLRGTIRFHHFASALLRRA